jgi:predicted DNA-binding transcriptional regulator AlpA
MQQEHRREDELLFTAQEVALRCRVHVYTFQRWCRLGAGPKLTLLPGDEHRYAASDVDAWLASRKVRVA